MISRIDHISIAVKDIQKAKVFFTTLLGAVPGTSGTDERLNFFWQVFSTGDLTRLELISPTNEGSFLDNFLANRDAGGAHHITFETPDIKAMRQFLDQNKIPYFDYHDEGPWKELFIHPKDAFGILIQIAEFAPDFYLADSEKLPTHKKWEIERTEQGCTLILAHPGGGKAQMNLSKSEIEALIDDLQRAC
ncbi:MAG: hypothetical protein HN580_08530 [Deltaproteobacteria bacterium]|nr:hypothetical protein [Deltaproteobacteria bacterium]MBT7484579.1 hypothetical protein [Candidatus Peregrinibacteria bacterium]MBT4268720.1 hypothetical protein [Deltaproteobacteria bacterium]MBT4638394.1 hypothetical protein [Deltaproteobacteria bacterium]MBT6500240.1 hypothetical protein [Deltaproteobacteria bacterium]